MDWRLSDGSTGMIDRTTGTVTRACDSWLVTTEAEFLAILDGIERHEGYDLRALMLESDMLLVHFGFGGDCSFVAGSRKRPPFESKSYFRPVPDAECINGRDTGFRLWHDDLFEFPGEQLITWDQALDILLWIIRHDELPEWDEDVGCRLLRRDSGCAEEDVPF
jgi:hypothetical protein